jgi:hypothetical protein
MMALRWAAAVLAGTVAAVAVVTTAQARPNAAGPQLLANAPSVVRAGTPTWVETHWLTGGSVCDFRLTATSTGSVEIGYPSNTAPFSSFYRSADLAAMRADNAAIRVTAPRPGIVPLWLHVSYTTCTGPAVVRTTRLSLPVL